MVTVLSLTFISDRRIHPLANELLDPNAEFDMGELSGRSKFADVCVANPELASTASIDFIPYIRFYSNKAKVCADEIVPINTFGLHMTPGSMPPEKNLGKDFEAVFLQARLLATMEVGEVFGKYYDPTTAEFQEAKAKALAKGMNNAFYGWEWLVWLPTHGSTLATIHFNNASMRTVEAATFGDHSNPNNPGPVKRTLRFASRKASNSYGDWTTPTITESSNIYKPEASFRSRFTTTYNAFVNAEAKGPLLSDPVDSGTVKIDR